MMETLVINFILSDLWYKKIPTAIEWTVYEYLWLYFLFYIHGKFPSLIYGKTCSSNKLFIYGMLSSNHENAKKKHIIYIKHIKVSLLLSRSVVNFIFIKYQTDLTLKRTKNVNIMDNIRVFMCVFASIYLFCKRRSKKR